MAADPQPDPTSGPSQPAQPSLDLVIPVYNEAHTLEGSVRRLAAAMAGHTDLPWRIVVVDNGSIDATAAIGRRLADELASVRFMHLDVKGRGGTLRAAWTDTDARFSLYMDVDLSTNLEAVPRAVELLRQGADIVTGSRLHPNSHITRCFKREFLSRHYNRLLRGLLGIRTFDDAQCGFKGVRVETVRRLLPLVADANWFFDTELLVLAEYAGLTICTLPITWIEDPDSRVHIPRTICEDLCGLWRLRQTARRLVQVWREKGSPVPSPSGRGLG